MNNVRHWKRTVLAILFTGIYLTAATTPAQSEIELVAADEQQPIIGVIQQMMDTCTRLFEPQHLIGKPITAEDQAIEMARRWTHEWFAHIFDWWCARLGVKIEPWLAEGLRTYYAWRACPTTYQGEFEQDPYLQIAGERYHGDEQTGKMSLQEAGFPWNRARSQNLLHNGSFLALLELDRMLQEEGANLDEIIQAMAEQHTIWSTDQLSQTIEWLTGADYSQWVATYIEGPSILPHPYREE